MPYAGKMELQLELNHHHISPMVQLINLRRTII